MEHTQQIAAHNTSPSLFLYDDSPNRPPAFVMGRLPTPRQRRQRPSVPAAAHNHITQDPSITRSAERSAERFGLICASIVNKTSVILGPPAKGTIRMLVPVYNPYTYNNIEQILHSHDRTLTEWHNLFKRYESSPFLQDIQTAIAAELRTAYYKNMRIRALLQVWVARVRTRIMNRRVVGNPDLYTTTHIPANVCVSVYDWHTKSKYLFHVNTILQTILTSLKYNNYGIACPQSPRNPYTNIPWNYGQCIHIMEQIMICQGRIHRFLPAIIELYRNAAYDVHALTAEKEFMLHIWAADTFFANRSDPVVSEIYMEVIDEIERDIHETQLMWLIIRYEIERRALSTDLMKRWDVLVVAYWIWQNHAIVWMNGRFHDYMVLNDALQDLYNESVVYYNVYNARNTLNIRNVRNTHDLHRRLREGQRIPLPQTPITTIVHELELANRLADRLTNSLTNRLTDSLTNRLIEDSHRMDRNESSTTINVIVGTDADADAEAETESNSGESQ